MTSTDDFDHDVSAWFHTDAERRVPPHLDAVLRRTRSEPQRPAWSSLERWLPAMDTATTYRSRVAAHRTLVVLAVVALLIAALGAVAITGAPRPVNDLPVVIVASPSPSPAPSPSPTIASNGRIYVGTSTGIKSFAADGSDPQTVVDLPDGDASGLAISPDGTKLAYLEGPEPGRIRIRTLASGDSVTVPLPAEMAGGDQVRWSPDSTEIAFPTFLGGKEYVYTAKTDGSPATRFAGDLIDPSMGIWFPSYSPDGRSIAFIGIADGAGQQPRAGDAYVANRDGSSLEKVAEAVEVGPGGTFAWSPDPEVRQLLMVRDGIQVLDVEDGAFTRVGAGFWPTWSPDGKRIAAWSDGLYIVHLADVPALSAEIVRPFGTIFGNCQDNPGLVGKAICGPVAWSSDGAHVFGPDILDTGIVVLPADGVGDPTLLANTGGPKSAVWVPDRP